MPHFDLTDRQGRRFRLQAEIHCSSHWAEPRDLLCAEQQLRNTDAGQLFMAEQHFFGVGGDFPYLRQSDLAQGGRLSAEASLPCSRLSPGSRDSLQVLLEAISSGELALAPLQPEEECNAGEQHQPNQLRVGIRLALADVITASRADAACGSGRVRGPTRVIRAPLYRAVFFNGLWEAGADIGGWLREINDVANPAQRLLSGLRRAHLAAEHKSVERDARVFVPAQLSASKRQLVEALGLYPAAISPEHFSRALAAAEMVWKDPALRECISRFAGDYVKALHPNELTRISGGAVFEIVFTILLTSVASGSKQALAAPQPWRRLHRFAKAGHLLLRFAEQAAAPLPQNAGVQPRAGASFADLESIEEVEVPGAQRRASVAPVKPREKPKREPASAERKGIPPRSLEDAVARLKSMAQEIAKNGYRPKYTDAELEVLASAGDVAKERYHVRFMESRYLTFNGEPGMLGAPLQGTSGNGAKYWSTTFDQVEDADTNSRLIAEKLGLEYDPQKRYSLIIIDTEKAAPLTGVGSVPASFAKVSEFANRELPQDFPESFTDIVMTPEFQAEYAMHYQKALDEEYLDSPWSTNSKDFADYLQAQPISDEQRELLRKRMEMQASIGNNQHYEGNGLTKDKIASSPNNYGVVETLNFERKPTDLKQLEEAGAIAYVSRDF